ncbi:MAG: hypothetical protein R6U46_12110 [Marinilabilia sp.]
MRKCHPARSIRLVPVSIGEEATLSMCHPEEATTKDLFLFVTFPLFRLSLLTHAFSLRKILRKLRMTDKQAHNQTKILRRLRMTDGSGTFFVWGGSSAKCHSEEVTTKNLFLCAAVALIRFYP